MTQALEAAKRARDRGANVHEARMVLRDARSAFERGDYAVAMERADYLLGVFGSGPAPAPPPLSGTPAVSLPETADAESARGWLTQATGSVREAKGRGLNVHIAKAALTQAKRAFKAGNYRAAIEFANQAVQLCVSAIPARP